MQLSRQDRIRLHEVLSLAFPPATALNQVNDAVPRSPLGLHHRRRHSARQGVGAHHVGRGAWRSLRDKPWMNDGDTLWHAQ